MPKFGSLLSKLNEKLEEAKISDLNHELGKWVQGKSDAFVREIRGERTSVLVTNARSSAAAAGGGVSKSLR